MLTVNPGKYWNCCQTCLQRRKMSLADMCGQKTICPWYSRLDSPVLCRTLWLEEALDSGLVRMRRRSLGISKGRSPRSTEEASLLLAALGVASACICMRRLRSLGMSKGRSANSGAHQPMEMPLSEPWISDSADACRESFTRFLFCGVRRFGFVDRDSSSAGGDVTVLSVLSSGEPF